MSRHKDWLKKKSVNKMFDAASSEEKGKVGPATEDNCAEKRYDPILKAWFFKRKPSNGGGSGSSNENLE